MTQAAGPTHGNYGTGIPDFDSPLAEVPKTASYTVLPSDNGTRFTNTGASGAVTFTLPKLAPGYVFEFLVAANQNVTITSNEGSNIMTSNNASASSLAFSSAGDLIGGFVRLETNIAGTKWYVKVLCKNAFTIS